MTRQMLIWPLLLMLSLSACSKVESTEQDSKMRFGTVRLFHTQNQPRGVVFLISDKTGWTDALTAEAGSMAHAGALVIGVDLPTYLANLRQSDDGCHYLISEVEELSKEMQRQFRFSKYQTPVLAGVGEGGTLAYAALAQSPAVTIAGALAVDPVEQLDTKVPLCPGATSSPASAGFSYAPADHLNGTWQYTLSQPENNTPAWAPAAQGQRITAFDAWLHGGRLKILVQPFLATGEHDPAGLDDLPLTPLPSAAEGDTLAIILSGDGGWRDLDKTIGETLSAGSISVVGWDTLRYFWDAHTPQQVADDLTRIINSYGALWHRSRILLVGYSFGADVLPAAYNLLTPDIRSKVQQISLLGASDTADFQFHVDGWLGLESGSATPTRPDLAKIDHSLLQCIYGDDDDDEICTDPVFNGARRDKLDGGHHYDGDYEALGKLIESAWAERGKTQP